MGSQHFAGSPTLLCSPQVDANALWPNLTRRSDVKDTDTFCEFDTSHCAAAA